MGNNEEFANRSSGAYIFRNDGAALSTPDPVEDGIVHGDVVEEVYSIHGTEVTQVKHN